jgi:hypothetical protein
LKVPCVPFLIFCNALKRWLSSLSHPPLPAHYLSFFSMPATLIDAVWYYIGIHHVTHCVTRATLWTLN